MSKVVNINESKITVMAYCECCQFYRKAEISKSDFMEHVKKHINGERLKKKCPECGELSLIYCRNH